MTLLTADGLKPVTGTETPNALVISGLRLLNLQYLHLT
jgi:hypothetical protein